MAAEQAENPSNAETWADWIAPGEQVGSLITREELIKAVAANGVKPVATTDIRYWEFAGIIPRSIKKHHKGATRAVYPRWMIDLVVLLRTLQNEGIPLGEIATRLRRSFWGNTSGLHMLATGPSGLKAGTQVWRVPPSQATSIAPMAAAFVTKFIDDNGIEDIGYIEVRIIGNDGRPTKSERYVFNELDENIGSLAIQ